jgi:hypothetical protein
MGLFGKVPVLLVATLLFFLLFVQPIAQAGTGGNVTCGALQNPVTIDGKWTNKNEWADAFEVSVGFVKGSGEVHFKAKHDDNFLYALVDFVSDSEIQTADMGAVVIDPGNDAGSAPQIDDFVLMGRWNSPTQFFSGTAYGTGTAWGNPGALGAGFNVASSKMADNDPYSASSHLIYEFQVPMSRVTPTGIGVYVAAFDRDVNIAAWPLAPMEVPSQYGYMQFTNQVVPEFPMGTTVILLMLLAAAGVLLRFSRKPYACRQRS